ncbi:ribosomal protein L14-domain-containing protein [Chiua virens]|nr:ribosomal protein L14-domain-containing protein [Chiua virens]
MALGVIQSEIEILQLAALTKCPLSSLLRYTTPHSPSTDTVKTCLSLAAPERAGWMKLCSDGLTPIAGLKLPTLCRVVLLNSGPSAGKIAVIAEIIDHNRAIIDGPTTSVPRQSFPYRHLSLTPLRLTKLPRAAGSGVIRKQLEKEGTVEKWENSAWAKKRAAIQKRRLLNDFARFEVMLAKKQRRDVIRKILAKKA